MDPIETPEREELPEYLQNAERRDNLRSMVLNRIRDSKEPVSELYLLHRLEYEHLGEISQFNVSWAITALLKAGEIRVASKVVTDFTKQRMFVSTDAKTCAVCGAQFTPFYKQSHCCGPACTEAYWHRRRVEKYQEQKAAKAARLGASEQLRDTIAVKSAATVPSGLLTPTR